jgi:hypothetical protein
MVHMFWEIKWLSSSWWWRQHVPLKRRFDNYFTRQYIPEDKSEQNDYNSVKIIDREIQILNLLKLSGNYMCHLLYLFKAER